MQGIYRVIAVNNPQTVSINGDSRTQWEVHLSELGGKYAEAYLAEVLGPVSGGCPLQPGAIFWGTIHSRVGEWDSQDGEHHRKQFHSIRDYEVIKLGVPPTPVMPVAPNLNR